jgi:hypothetical protein
MHAHAGLQPQPAAVKSQSHAHRAAEGPAPPHARAEECPYTSRVVAFYARAPPWRVPMRSALLLRCAE